jgi:hypothetical protein
MIEGIRNTDDYRFGDNINKFIKLLSSVTVSCVVNKKANGNEIIEEAEITFNNCKSIETFSTLIQNKYSVAASEIQENLTEILLKYDKATFIIQLINKFKTFEKLLYKTSNDEFKHKNFHYSLHSDNEQYSNINFIETLCQEYYQVMVFYLYSMQTILGDFRDIHAMCSQSDFPAPLAMVIHNNKSTKEYPFKFFEQIYTSKGFSSLIKQFEPTIDDYANFPIRYDVLSRTITYEHYDIETGEHTETTKTFEDFYSDRLLLEFSNSSQLIDDHVYDLQELSHLSFFITKILIKLNDLMLLIKSNTEAMRFTASKKPIIALIKHINNISKSYFPSDVMPPKNIKPASFKLIGSEALIHGLATDLHTALVSKHLIKDFKKDFIKLFTGKIPDNKISWIGQKGELKSFIDCLLLHKKIEKCQSNKWQITAENFKFFDDEFDNEKMNNTKKAKNNIKIEQIVKNIRL